MFHKEHRFSALYALVPIGLAVVRSDDPLFLVEHFGVAPWWVADAGPWEAVVKSAVQSAVPLRTAG